MHDINNLLDNIVTRTIAINKKQFSGDNLLDIDLVQDDIRHLYRRLEALRSVMAQDTEMPPAVSPAEKGQDVSGSEASRPAAPHEPPGEEQKDEREGAAQTEILPGDTEAPAQGADTPAPETSATIREQGSGEQSAERQATSQEVSGEDTGHKDRESVPPTASDSDTTDSSQNTEKPANQPPTGHSVDQPEKQKQKPSKGNGNRAVIDILSEYGNKTIGDTYLEENDSSLHTRISLNKEDRSIGERMQKQPLSNLKEAIGVNEKFLFINELFDGNIQAYNDAISRLNAMNDSREAFDYLGALGIEFSWDAARSADTIEKLAQLVQRRYVK